MKKIVKTHKSAFNLPTLKLEGALFLPDQLEKAALGTAEFQDDASYQVPAGLKQKDEYSRAFQIASAQWRQFAAHFERQDVNAKVATESFVQQLLAQVFSYHGIASSEPVVANERSYAITFMAAATPIVVAPFTLGLDESSELFAVEGSGSKKKSAFQFAQELLNASEEHLWAIVTNGKQLRLLRDAASLTRPSFLEIDLEDILQAQRFSEFSSAWRLLHASRAPENSQHNSDCIWEKWREQGQQEGTRVRDGLRHGVEQALMTLGTGFLQHPDNHKLREALHTGELSKDDYFQQLLRLIYRFIFLFTVEERELLHPKDSSPEALTARQLYAQGYALSRLRELSLKRRARNRFSDQWQALRIVFKGLQQGEPRLALPALGGLFAAEQTPDLDQALLSNADFLQAIQHLRWAVVDNNVIPVDYRNMGPEELGSVYESLLELVPVIHYSNKTFGFVGISEEGSTAGNKRKLTGSYYTPDSLVQELIKSALEPVIASRLKENRNNPTEALLSIRVIDPSCGSGHFLLAAARRLAEALAQLRSQEGVIQPADYRRALREVINHCIFGVDLNPMAIELARMTLWLEGFEEGKPLSFLDHHLQVGNALLGLTELNALEQGISKDAFKALSGDDKEICKALNAQNTLALKQLNQERQSPQFKLPLEQQSQLNELARIEAMPQGSLEEIQQQEAAYLAFLNRSQQSPLRNAADMLLGAYLLEKTSANQHSIPTTASLMLELQGKEGLGEEQTNQHQAQLAAAQAACQEARVFHWPIVFPQVFAAGGFDCVLGNPPWERIKLQEEEFFASRSPDIVDAKNKAERSQRIQWLSEGMLTQHLHGEPTADYQPSESEKRLYREFVVARRTAEAASIFAHVKGEEGGRYPLTGKGDVNTYALFAETISQINHAQGRAGFIVPTGIATDDSTKAFFGAITQGQRLVSLYDIENREAIFEGVHRSYKFCLLTLGYAEQADFVCFATQVAQLSDARRRFSLTAEDFQLINPNTLTCPVFRSQQDAELTKKLYRAAPVLIKEAVKTGTKILQPEQNSWGISFSTMFHMSNDSHLFLDEPQANTLPLYEAKLIHHFDHRFATYEADGSTRDTTSQEKQNFDFAITPRYWVSAHDVAERLCKRDRDGSIIWQWDRKWLMGWRGITNATNDRTVIGSILPLSGVGNSLHLLLISSRINASKVAAFLANTASLTLDYIARQKIGGTNFNFFIPKQMPFFSPEQYAEADLAFIVPRVLELTYTSHDLKPWAEDLGYFGEPFVWDEERRATLRAELDAYYAKLYGLTRDELRYILDPADIMGDDYPSETFRVLKNKEIKEHGEYRTQRLVLEAWDALEQQSENSCRRVAPQKSYSPYVTPNNETEDWLAGLIFDILLAAGSCTTHQLRNILQAKLSNSAYASDLETWTAPVLTERWEPICRWLHEVLDVPLTNALSIKNMEMASVFLGDERTRLLASELIAEKRAQDLEIEKILKSTQPIAQEDGLKKQG